MQDITVLLYKFSRDVLLWITCIILVILLEKFIFAHMIIHRSSDPSNIITKMVNLFTSVQYISPGNFVQEQYNYVVFDVAELHVALNFHIQQNFT